MKRNERPSHAENKKVFRHWQSIENGTAELKPRKVDKPDDSHFNLKAMADHYGQLRFERMTTNRSKK